MNSCGLSGETTVPAYILYSYIFFWVGNRYFTGHFVQNRALCVAPVVL